MKRIYILPAIALLGLVIAIVVIVSGNKPASIKTQGFVHYQPPYESYISASGVVESPTGNISIGTPVSGVVMQIYVKVGDKVKPGDPLFKIDDRDLQARLVVANAKVNEAKAALQKPVHHLEHGEQLKKRDPKAISVQALDDLRDEAAQAEAMLDMAMAQVSQLKLEIERRTVRALVPGEILQLKMRLGEFVEASGITPELLVLGGNNRMNVRVDVDERDAWRVSPGAKAVAFVRGHPEIQIPLHYAYTEPQIVPKMALTGLSTERTDMRVLQVLYSFERAQLPVHIGQQLDVFIESAVTPVSGKKP